MSAFPSKKSMVAVAWLALWLGGLGCSKAGNEVKLEAPSGYQNLRAIVQSYYKATTTLGGPPRNLDDLMPFLKKQGDPSQILRSPDDGQEYKILWGVDLRRTPAAGARPQVVAYEKQGKDGKRYVILGHNVVQLDDEAFKKLGLPPG